MSRHLVWFSCGAASAAAAKIAVESYSDVEVVYCNTMESEHPDNIRFFADVERWIGRRIRIIKSDKYETVDAVFERRRFMSGPMGAPCTTEMKKIPREAFQDESDTHVFGYTLEERNRADDFEAQNPKIVVEWLLIDRFIRKQDCQRMLREAGIARPAMYGLGFEHNNCIGCVKSSSPGYWNRVRRLFPEVFAKRAAQSRLLGVKLVRIGEEVIDGKRVSIRVSLDELDPNLDAADDTIECGPGCQTRMKL